MKGRQFRQISAHMQNAFMDNTRTTMRGPAPEKKTARFNQADESKRRSTQANRFFPIDWIFAVILLSGSTVSVADDGEQAPQHSQMFRTTAGQTVILKGAPEVISTLDAWSSELPVESAESLIADLGLTNYVISSKTGTGNVEVLVLSAPTTARAGRGSDDEERRLVLRALADYEERKKHTKPDDEMTPPSADGPGISRAEVDLALQRYEALKAARSESDELTAPSEAGPGVRRAELQKALAVYREHRFDESVELTLPIGSERGLRREEVDSALLDYLDRTDSPAPETELTPPSAEGPGVRQEQRERAIERYEASKEALLD